MFYNPEWIQVPGAQDVLTVPGIGEVPRKDEQSLYCEWRKKNGIRFQNS